MSPFVPVLLLVVVAASCGGADAPLASEPAAEPTELVADNPIYCASGLLVDAEGGEPPVEMDDTAVLTRLELEDLIPLAFGRGADAEGLAEESTLIVTGAPGVTGVLLTQDGVDVGYLEAAKMIEGEVVYQWFTVCEEVFGP